MSAPSPNVSHEEFMRLFIQSERELLRYIMATVPSAPDARDILQMTAVALWKKITDYNRDVPFTPWACRFASNEIRGFLRRERRHRRWLDEDVADLLRIHQEQALLGQNELSRTLLDCLSRMPMSQRQLLQGYYFDNQSAETLASRLRRSVEAVYKALQRARKALHDCVDRKTEWAA